MFCLVTRAILAGAVAVTLAGVACAQSAPAAPAQPGPEAAAPAMTDVQALQDWTVRCFKIESPSPCDMTQMVMDNNTKKRLMQVSIGYAPGAGAYGAQIVVPLGVSLAQGLTLSVGEYKVPNIHFRRCMRDGCYVEAQLDPEAIEAMSKAQQGMITVIGWGDAHVFDLPLSLKGFNEAHAAMVKLNRAKATSAPPAPAPANP